jgi:hypothetical protein
MKTTLYRLITSLVIASSFASCTTVYDAQGRPRQMVDPGAALIGAAVVGLVAYGIANSNDNDRQPCRQNTGWNGSNCGRGGWNQNNCGNGNWGQSWH